MICHRQVSKGYFFTRGYVILLYLSVSTRAGIGQFCGLYFTVRPANFERFFSRAPDYPQRYNKYLTNLVFSVRTVSYGSSFFPVDLWPARFALGP